MGRERRKGAAIFHGFRVRANFNNIRSIRYGRPHIKSVRGERGVAGAAGCDESGARGGTREERDEERRGSYRRFGRGVARAGAAQNETCNKVSF